MHNLASRTREFLDNLLLSFCVLNRIQYSAPWRKPTPCR